MKASGNTPESNHRYARRLVQTLIVVVAMLTIWHTLHIFLLIFLSVILGVFLHRSGVWMAAKLHVGRRLGTAIVVSLLVLASSAVVLFLLPRIDDQMVALGEQLPGAWIHLRETVAATPLGNWLDAHMPSLEQIAGGLGGVMHEATAWLYSVLGAFTGTLIIAVMGLYLAFDAPLYRSGIEKLVAKGKRERAAQILQSIASTLYWWLIGRLISMLIIGVSSILGLIVLGVPLAMTLGLFAAVMAFIPNLGPLIALIPAALLALQEGWSKAFYVAILYTVIQTVESYLVTPMVQRRTIAIPPAIILSAQLVMGVIQGVLGVLVATPLVAVIMVLTKLLYLEDILDDHQVHVRRK